MKDRLLYLTIGLLIGMVVMQWGMSSRVEFVPTAQAGYVDHTATGIIAMNESVMLDQFGKMWELHESAGWIELPMSPVPVPVSDLKFIHQARLVTIANVGWIWSNGAWQEIGPWPGGQPVPTDKQSWGNIKNKYKPEGD